LILSQLRVSFKIPRLNCPPHGNLAGLITEGDVLGVHHLWLLPVVGRIRIIEISSCISLSLNVSGIVHLMDGPSLLLLQNQSLESIGFTLVVFDLRCQVLYGHWPLLVVL